MTKEETIIRSNLTNSHSADAGEPFSPEALFDDDFVDFDFLKNQNQEETTLLQESAENKDPATQRDDPAVESLNISDETFGQDAPDFEFLKQQKSDAGSEENDLTDIGLSDDREESSSQGEAAPQSVEESLSQETTVQEELELSFLEDSGGDGKNSVPVSSEMPPEMSPRSQGQLREKTQNFGKSVSNDFTPQTENISDNETHSRLEGKSAPWDFVSNSFSRKWSIGSIVETGTYLGLDIGQGVTKYVLAKKQGREKVVRAFGILENPRGENVDTKKSVHEVLQRLEKQGLLEGAKINLALYGPDVGIHRMSLPPLKKKELTEATEWSLRKKYDFQNQEIIDDFLVLGKKIIKGVEHNDILAGVVPVSIVEERIEPFLEKKITPWHLRPLPFVLWSLYRAANIQDAGNCVAMIDIGAKKTLITFVREGAIEFTREIPSGGDDITAGMTGTIFHEGRAFQLSWEEAEKVKRTFGFPLGENKNTNIGDVPLVEISALMRPHLERLSSEVQRSIDYYRENFSVEKIDRVYLLGGAAGMKNLVEFFRKEIDEEIELFQFSTHFPLNLPSNEAKTFHNRFLELAVALGLALGGGDSINLLPEPLQKVEIVRLQKRLFFYVSLLTIIAILFLSGTSFFKVSSLKNQFRQMQLEYKKIQPKKQRYDALVNKKKFLLSKKGIYQNELILDNPLPDILKLVSQIIPSEMALTGMAVTREEIAPEKTQKGNRGKGNSHAATGASKGQKKRRGIKASFLRLSGVRYHPRPDEGIRIANFMLHLRDSGYFQSVALLNQSLSEEEDELHFEILCRF